MAGLQAEVASLRGHRARCEHATLSLLRELLQVRACLQLQDAQLKRLQLEARQAVPAPEKEAIQVGRVPTPGGIASLDPEPHSAQAQHSDNPRGPAPRPRLHSARVSASQLPGPQQQNQMQALDKRYHPPYPPLTEHAWGRKRVFGEAAAAARAAGPSPGLWFPPTWRLARVSKSVRSSTREGLVARAREPGSPGRGLRLGQAPTPKAAQPAPGRREGAGGPQAPGRGASCVPGWWKSGRP